MTLRKRFITSVVCLSFVLSTALLSDTVLGQSTPGSAPSEIRQSLVSQLEKRDQEIKQLIGDQDESIEGEQREVLSKIVFDLLDAEALAAHALQDTFDIISDEDRSRFVDLFARILRDQSLANLDIYRAEITYDSVAIAQPDQLRPTGDYSDITYVVYTKARFEEVETPVLYVMALGDNSSWRILDMSIDDVYTGESYRRQFQSIMRSRGFQPLLESLQRRADRI